MSKVLVLYHSNSGNTARMAQLVADGAGSVPETEVRLRSLAEATAADVVWCDGVAVGSPTNMGLISWQMKRFWDETMAGEWMKVDGKIGCAFSSSGGWGGGNELACLSILTVLMNFGLLVFGVTDYVGKLTTLHYGAVTVREPRGDDEQAACRKLGQRLAEWTGSLIDGRNEVHPLVRGEPRLPPGQRPRAAAPPAASVRRGRASLSRFAHVERVETCTAERNRCSF